MKVLMTMSEKELGDLRDDLTFIKLSAQNVVEAETFPSGLAYQTLREIIDRVDVIAKRLNG